VIPYVIIQQLIYDAQTHATDKNNETNYDKNNNFILVSLKLVYQPTLTSIYMSINDIRTTQGTSIWLRGTINHPLN